MNNDFENIEQGQLVPGIQPSALANQASALLESYSRLNKAPKGEDDCKVLMFAPIVGAMLPETSTTAPPSDAKGTPKHNEALPRTNDALPKPESKESKPPEKLKAKEVEIGDGITDLSDVLGKNSRFVRDHNSDTLRLPDGSKVSVTRSSRDLQPGDKAFIAVTDESIPKSDRFNHKEWSSILKAAESSKPITLEGGKTFVKIGATGQIEAIRKNGQVYKFVTPKLE